MGCGTVFGVHSPYHTQHTTASRTVLSSLAPLLNICEPFIGEKTFRSFQQAVKEGHELVLAAPKRVQESETSTNIMEKWRILLYGTHKADEIYRLCLSFEVRQDLVREGEGQLTGNKSYHQLRAVTSYHECFNQIEKDLNRTFDFQADKRLKFEQILKRISNYFPSMGYTQGVNFVVGYLLLLGYSQSDTFWLFVHLAQSRRYLILGLYEEGFPLAYIYTTVFNNMLKRMDPELHSHLYVTLMLDDASWIFKWFITYFVYSFPLCTIQYLWNAVIQIGGIAVVYYALAITLSLKKQLIETQDPCDFVIFWKNLKEIESFNELIKMSQVMDKTYQMKVVSADFQGIKQSPHSFYREYFIHLIEQATNDAQLNKLLSLGAREGSNAVQTLHNWYARLSEERLQFQEQPDESLRSFSRRELVPDELRSEYQEMAKSIRDLQEQVMRNQSQKEIEKSNRNLKPDDFFEDLQEDGASPPSQVPPEEIQEEETEPRLRTTIIKQLSYDLAAQIDEEENESGSNNSQTCQGDQRPVKVNTYLGIDYRKRTLKGQQLTKAGMMPSQAEPGQRTGLSLAGQNILCNISVTNSHYSSQSSKQSSSFKPKKQKENTMHRQQPSGKVRTEQGSLPSSEQEESLGTLDDNNSASGYSHRGPVRSNKGGEQHMARRTQQDLMTSSHGPEQTAETGGAGKELGSQIQLFNGGNLFKKKKRLYRNSNLSIQGHQPQALRISGLQKLSQALKTEPQEESLDSGIATSSRKRPTQKSNIDQLLCQIESIK